MGNFYSSPGFTPPGRVACHLAVHTWRKCLTIVQACHEMEKRGPLSLEEFMRSLTDVSRLCDGFYTEASPEVFSALEETPGGGVLAKHLVLALTLYSEPGCTNDYVERYKTTCSLWGGGGVLSLAQLGDLITDLIAVLSNLGVVERLLYKDEAAVIAREVADAAAALAATSSGDFVGSGGRHILHSSSQYTTPTLRKTPTSSSIPLSQLVAFAVTHRGVHSMCTRFKFTPPHYAFLQQNGGLPPLVETVSPIIARSLAMDACMLYVEEGGKVRGRLGGWAVASTAPSIPTVLLGTLQALGVRRMAAGASSVFSFDSPTEGGGGRRLPPVQLVSFARRGAVQYMQQPLVPPC